MKSADTTVCVVGGGPAGLVLGLLLARAGVPVTVLEKHADFLRDFRGDTVHASTLDLLDELGLGEAFAALPQRWVDRVRIEFDGGIATIGDLSRLPGPHRHIALVPQWDLLELLARTASHEPSFTLRRNAEVVGLLTTSGSVIGSGEGAVTGVRYVDRTDGTEHELTATLTVACDGRDSAVRAAAGMRPRVFGVPMDVEWFRLPRREGDPAGLLGRVTPGQIMVFIDRGDYWQCAFLVAKGSDATLRARPIEEFRQRLTAIQPWLGDRVAALTGWDDVRLLAVSLNRMRRWYRPGLLLIGDAAHAMSPVGGVGINLAVQDAVAAARILAPPLRLTGEAGTAVLRRVQRRRAWPTAVVQTAQRVAHRVLIRRALGSPAAGARPAGAGPAGAGPAGAGPAGERRLPVPLRVLSRYSVLQGLPARAVAIGPLPEHAPAWARR